jgi:hypothetical protein
MPTVTFQQDIGEYAGTQDTALLQASPTNLGTAAFLKSISGPAGSSICDFVNYPEGTPSFTLRASPVSRSMAGMSRRAATIC